MSKYLKLIAVVEDDYVPITGQITTEPGTNIWDSENVMAIRLKDNFAVIDDVEFQEELGEFLERVLVLAEERSNADKHS